MNKVIIIIIVILILFILINNSYYLKKEIFKNNNIKIAILIISDNKHKNNKSFNRWLYEKEVWKKYMNKNKNIDCFFIECSKDEKINNKDNFINSKCLESYVPGIYQKTLHSLKILKNKYDYYIRTNLSTFTIFDNLIKNIKKLPNEKYIYTGTKLNYSPNEKKIKFMAGSNIILNNKTVNILLKYGFQKKYYNSKLPDDVNISCVIKDNLGNIANSYNIIWRHSIENNKLRLNLTKIPFIRYKNLSLENKKKISRELLHKIYNI